MAILLTALNGGPQSERLRIPKSYVTELGNELPSTNQALDDWNFYL